MSNAPARPVWQGRTLALVGIVLFAFTLRTAVASLSPLTGYIAEDFDLPAVAIGLIGTAPPVCYAIFGILTPQFERRFGLERLVVLAAAVAAVGMVARALSNDAVTLLLLTALTFAAVGVGNILLPPLVKTYFPDRVGLLTTVYTSTMATATFLPPLIAVPAADAVGWRVSLGMWALFAVLAALPWIALVARERAAAEDDDDDVLGEIAPGVFGRLWSLPLAWALTATMVVSSTVAYTCFAWLPTILVDIGGVQPATAGLLLSLFAMIGLPCSLVVPILVARLQIVRTLFAVAIVSGLLGVAGLVLAPAAAPWLWTALLGVAPLLFPMVLVLLSLRSRTHEGAVALSGFVQSVGYAITATIPLLFGLLHDATDGWTLPLGLLALVILIGIPASFIVARGGTIESAWERRHGAW
ncbi:MFS transporter [Microbacterium sp. P02]|uniref:MFS transporter n=2 Tax=unclassified Microbacterium TaxID=2609290 RepID=UPI00366F213E